MKHILLPCDFSILSLQPVHDVMQNYPDDSIRITLLHLVDMPTGIGDLLFRYHRIAEKFPVPEDFNEACELMSNRYKSRIISIVPVLRYGNSSGFLENLLKGMKVDAVFTRRNWVESGPFRESVALMPLLNRIECNLIETPAQPKRAAGLARPTVGDLLLVGG